MSFNPLRTPNEGWFVEICPTKFESFPYSFLKQNNSGIVNSKKSFKKSVKPEHRYMDGEKSYREGKVNIKDTDRRILSNIRNCVSHSDRILFLTSQQTHQTSEMRKNRGEVKMMINEDTYENRLVGVVRSVNHSKKTAKVRLLNSMNESEEEQYSFCYLRVISRDEMRKIFKANIVNKNVAQVEKEVKDGTKIQQMIINQKKEEAKRVNGTGSHVDVHGKNLYLLLSGHRNTDNLLHSFQEPSIGLDSKRRKSIGQSLVDFRDKTRRVMSSQFGSRSTVILNQLRDERKRFIVGNSYDAVVDNVRCRKLSNGDIDFYENVYLELKVNTEEGNSTMMLKLDFIHFVSASIHTKIHSEFSNARETCEKICRICVRELEDMLLDKHVKFIPTVEKSDLFGCTHANLYYNQPAPEFLDRLSNESGWIQAIALNRGLAAIDPECIGLEDEEYNQLLKCQQSAQSSKRGIWKHYEVVGIDSPSRRRPSTYLPNRLVRSSMELGHRSMSPSEERYDKNYLIRSHTTQGIHRS